VHVSYLYISRRRSYDGKKVLGRPRRKYEDNIKMDLIQIGFGLVDWMYLSPDWHWWCVSVNTIRNLRVKQGAGYLLTGRAYCWLLRKEHSSCKHFQANLLSHCIVLRCS
jgi:hypothetical protein